MEVSTLAFTGLVLGGFTGGVSGGLLTTMLLSMLRVLLGDGFLGDDTGMAYGVYLLAGLSTVDESIDVGALLAVAHLHAAGVPLPPVATPATPAQSESPLIGRWDLVVDAPGRHTASWMEVRHSGRSTLIGAFVNMVGSARPIARIDRLGLFNDRLIAVHMTQLTESEIAACAEAGVSIAHCPESNLKLASGFAPIEALRLAGANIALGTDGAASNNDLDMFEAMRQASSYLKVSLLSRTPKVRW